MTNAAREIPVVEIFGPTIQGEGVNAGRVSVFVRFGGCSFRCAWCDSMHAVDPRNSKDWAWMSPDDIVRDVRKIAPNGALIVLTGGDPAIHAGLGYVVGELHVKGFDVQVETQGAINMAWLDRVDSLCLSPKPPSSGMECDVELLRTIADRCRPAAFIKIPVADEFDLAFADEIHAAIPWAPFYVQPVNRTPGIERDAASRLDEYRRLIEVVTGAPHRGRWHVLPQIHVLAWGERRGV